MLNVRRSLEQSAERRFKEPKTKKSRRTVVVPRFAVESLRAHRLAQMERFLALGLGRPTRETLIFERLGEPWNPSTFSADFYRLMKRLKMRVRFHDLRHAFATLSLRAGTSLRTVSESLGHETLAMTADVYAHVLDNLKTEAADRLGATLEGALKTAQSEAV